VAIATTAAAGRDAGGLPRGGEPVRLDPGNFTTRIANGVTARAVRDTATKGGRTVEAGVDGATAGIVMPVKPRVGMSYRQEYYKGHAEDRAKILSLGEQVEVPFGRFKHARC
jgi:hypothetical protein